VTVAERETRPAPWWVRPGLDVVDGRLRVAGHEVEPLLRELGAPLFIYDLDRFAENAVRLRSALRRAGLTVRQRFALKANREPPVLAALRAVGPPGSPDAIGIDACSPGEVAHALANGWRADEISVTATNLSERDLDQILAQPVHLNLDAVTQIERVGRRADRGATIAPIGIRINPGVGAGYHDGLAYSGARPTKFGIYEERIPEAIEAARRHGLAIDTVHVHPGSGWLADGLESFGDALEVTARVARHLLAEGCPISEINIGGGLGVAARIDEQTVDVDAYAAVVARHLGSLGVAIGSEPGDYIAKDAAVLLAEVVTVEERRGVTFVGLDIGWNVDCSYFIYRFAQEIVLCHAADAPATNQVTIVGNINEASDVFAEDYLLPPVAEGDAVAILNAGGYHQAMASTHCLRPTGQALFLRRPAS
jgi:diaminopimelate decarboxylase